jgi:hypothetical protein
VLSFAAIALAAASAATTPTLTSNTPWWEKITVTYDGNGSHRACNYETSLAYAQTQEACDMGSARTEAAKAAASNAGVQTKITFERRFTPGTPPELDSLEPGDTLIGGLMMLVAIGEDGAVRACSVIAESGDDKPSYGCEQVRAERFQASIGPAPKDSRVGFLTVLVYGHEEEVV